MAGTIPVEVHVKNDIAHVTMTQIAPVFGAKLDPAMVAAVGGLSDEDIVGTPQVVSTGLPFCITVLRSKEVLRRARMNVDALEIFRAQAGDPLANVMEPFWVSLGGATEQGDTYSRLLLAPPGPAEDPFTGSASGAMAAYLWANGLIDSPNFVAEQGMDIGRPGRADVEVIGTRQNITGVRVSGSGYVLMRGEINI